MSAGGAAAGARCQTVARRARTGPVRRKKREHPAMHAAAAAYRRGFDVAPAFVLSGGTIPAVNTFARVLSIPTILMGFARPDDRIHAANEKFQLAHFERGIASCIWFLHELRARHTASRPAAHPASGRRPPDR